MTSINIVFIKPVVSRARAPHMPVNPVVPTSDDDIRDCLAEMGQYALGEACEQLNNSVRAKLLIYAMGNALPWSLIWYHRGFHAMLGEIFTTVCIVALAYAICFVVARAYTVRLHTVARSDFMLMMLAHRAYAAPTHDEIDRLVRFVASPRTLAKCPRDSPALEARCVAMTAQVCALWKTQQLYKLLLRV